MHDYLIDKVEVYDSSYEVLKVNKENKEINNFSSDLINLLIGLPQGSVLDPLLFTTVYVNDIT